MISRTSLPGTERTGGVIVNVSSSTTKMVGAGVAPYSSTKHVLNATSLAARQELEPDHISVGLVFPFVTATEFHNHLANLANSEEGQGPRFRSGSFKMDTPEHVAD